MHLNVLLVLAVAAIVSCRVHSYHIAVPVPYMTGAYSEVQCIFQYICIRTVASNHLAV